jgi:predicted alpha-1,2-mannosidase
MSLSRHRRRSTVVVGALGALAGLLAGPLSTASATNGPAAARVDAATYVNPLIGTGSGGDVVGQVDTFPGATAPFGMLTLSPQTTPTGADGGGYYYGDNQVSGIALTHISGPGCSAAGDLPFLPTSGAVPANPYETTESFAHASEHASPGYYSVALGSPAVTTALTATTRTGLADMTFPSGANGNVLFKVAGSQNGATNTAVQLVGDNEVQGQATSGHFCGSPGTYNVYFAAKFNRPFTAAGTWQQALQGANLLGSDQTGTLGWGGPDNNGCASNTGSLSSAGGGASENWTASCVTGQTWAQVTPSGLTNGGTYQASVTLEANSTTQTAPIYLDFYNGCVDTSSNIVSLTPGKPVTLTDTTTIGCSNTPQFQVRTSAGGSIDLNISKASVQQVVEQPDPGATSASGSNAAAYASFSTASSNTVQMQVAISYVSEANAWANLKAEQGNDPSFAGIERQTRALWDKALDQIEIDTGTTADLTSFYTGLYHALLDPSVVSDVNGQYPGFDGHIHTVSAGQQAQYANFSGWDIYRSEVQLLAMVEPTRTGDMMQSLVNDANQGGWLPKWPLAQDYTNVMNGDAADSMIADAYAFGVRNFDVQGALAAMVKGATQAPTASQVGQGWYVERPQLADYLKLGYTPNVEETSLSPVDNGASQTLEYALGDFGISQLASALGQTATAKTFAQRAQNWENLLNPNTGYLQPRDGSGNFPTGNPLTVGYGSFGQSGFQEGNAAQYNFAAPQNLAALINLMGGQAKAQARLDTFFTQLNAGPNQPYYWAGNETDLNAPWVYDYAGEPYRTQALVRDITSSLYSPTPGGEPGNDDLGAMSSWLVWADLGLYPETAGSPVLAVGSPLFDRADVRLASGRTLVIEGKGAGDSAPYVTSLQVNRQATNNGWVSFDALRQGAFLHFTLSSTPDKAWGASAADAPPSYAQGSAPAVVAPAGTVQVSPGGTSTAQLVVANATSSAQTVSWAVSVPTGSGLSATPSSGSAVIPVGGGSIPVHLSATAGAPQTFTNVTVSASDGGVTLPTEDLLAQVARAGSLASYFNNRGVSDDTNPMAADFDGGGYSYSAQALAAAKVTPGSTVTAGGATYTWPASAPGDPDNVVANGQKVDVANTSGATTLDLLASSTNGPSSGTLTLDYANGTTATAPIAVTDWAAGSPTGGNTVAIATAYRNCGCGSAVNGTTSVYSISVPLASSSPLAAVTLPADTNQGEIHIFAVSTH